MYAGSMRRRRKEPTCQRCGTLTDALVKLETRSVCLSCASQAEGGGKTDFQHGDSGRSPALPQSQAKKTSPVSEHRRGPTAELRREIREWKAKHGCAKCGEKNPDQLKLDSGDGLSAASLTAQHAAPERIWRAVHSSVILCRRCLGAKVAARRRRAKQAQSIAEEV